ncbi:MAG: Cof-type HAD-IIB family hydrolase [Fimbriimonas sp.]|nr:Cof-type HAD-IIB family hydrolase [Fimbriimonas sp.]
MRTKLLATDIDGTLLTSERTPHTENVEAIRRAGESGIRVVLASGRIASSMARFSEELGLDGAMICSNGGHVKGLHGKEILYVGLPHDVVATSLAYAESAGVHVNTYTRDQIFVLRETPWLEKYRQRVRTLMPEFATIEYLTQTEILKIILIDEPEAIPVHRAALEELLGTRAALTESEPEYLEILSSNANKGMGLRVLAESLGVRREETAAIGDYLNDLEMVQWAGVGGAVSNAVAEVKAAADVQVPSNNEAGVARFIDYLLERNAREDLIAD